MYAYHATYTHITRTHVHTYTQRQRRVRSLLRRCFARQLNCVLISGFEAFRGTIVQRRERKLREAFEDGLKLTMAGAAQQTSEAMSKAALSK